MYDHSLHLGRNHFCLYCLHGFITEEILKRHVKDCFKLFGMQTIKIPKEGECIKFQNFERKNKITIYDLCRF